MKNNTTFLFYITDLFKGDHMSNEIEKKYLVISNDWEEESSHTIIQGYISKDKNRVVRIRIFDDAAFITIKGISIGIERAEYEYAIPLEDGYDLLKLCHLPILEKKRSIVLFDNKKWEIDEFMGENEGLVVAEIELESIGENYALPPWLGKEVSNDPRYFNSNLIDLPFRNWKKENG